MRTRIAGAVLAAAATVTVTGQAAVPASASSVPVVYGVPDGHAGSNFVHGKVRPAGTLMWTGDGSAWFRIHSWSSWSAKGAWGSATVHVRSCWGNCFHYKTEHTTLHFYRVRTHHGQGYFARLHFHLAHKVAGLGSGTLRFFSSGTPAWYY